MAGKILKQADRKRSQIVYKSMRTFVVSHSLSIIEKPIDIPNKEVITIMKAYKKILAGRMAASLAAPFAVLKSSALEPPRPKGDINYDGVFNLSDTVMFGRWLHGTGSISDSSNADINGDGSIDIFDFVAMRKKLLGVISNAEQKYKSSGSFSLCAGLEDAHPDGTKIDDKFRNGQAQFTLDIFKREFKEDENSLVSPYSIMQALAMTANGANGETKKALGGLPIEDLDKYLATWRRNQPDSEECKLLTANSVWIRDNEVLIKPQPQFIQNVVDYFNAEVFKAPFDKSTVNDINSWVSDHTDEMIPSIIDDLPDICMMTLVNAVTFEAKWMEPYEEYQVQPFDFTAYDGSVKSVDMLCGSESIYLEDENSKGFMKYYDDSRYAFVAVLPDEDVNIKDYVDSLTVEKMAKLYDSQKNGYNSVVTRMPKFKYDCDMILNNTLVDMGMETAFNPDRADFYNMVTPDSLPLYISQVIHKTHIELDEYGTKAAAATAIMMCGGAGIQPEIKEVFLDRPFVYAIVDTQAELPVFIGAVMDLGQE